MYKAKVGIIGTGNIGTNLLMKIARSELLECTIFAGKNPNSPNIIRAGEMGINVSGAGIQALLEQQDQIDIIMDATSAQSHINNKELFESMGKYMINLTPTNGELGCVPCINWDEAIHCREVNMITCGGQATIPLAYAIMQTGCEVSYIETVSTISAKSAGQATRENIDEFIETTSGAMRRFTGVEKTKAIMIINSNEPPVNMRNTIYMRLKKGDMSAICEAVSKMESRVAKYVPGYRIVLQPAMVDDILAITLEVSGSGDFLPEYAGNLDIITCAAVEMAEKYCNKVLRKG